MQRIGTAVVLSLLLLAGSAGFCEDDQPTMSKPAKNDPAPSKDQVYWTSTHLSYDLDVEYSYVGTASSSFGDGVEGDVDSHHTLVSNVFTARSWMAFLFHGGVEWQRYGFGAPASLPIPEALSSLVFPVAIDFRWSEKDMMRLQTAPGFYSHSSSFNSEDFNAPFAVAYTRIFSKRFQLGLGLSVNPVSANPILGGGGFRWQINDRWKLKFLMPRPQVEYRAAPALHLWAGSDFAGDTFRVSDDFGTGRNDPRLDKAWVDYQEIRAGGGFSWNILPLLELNGEAGYLLSRKFNYHNNDLRSTSGKAPYVSLNLRYLFLIREDKRTIPEQKKALEDELPWLRRAIRAPR